MNAAQASPESRLQLRGAASCGIISSRGLSLSAATKVANCHNAAIVHDAVDELDSALFTALVGEKLCARAAAGQTEGILDALSVSR